MIYDAVSHRMTTENPSGACGFISWSRLCDLLKSSGEVSDKEMLKALKIDERGISFFVK